MTVEMNGDRVHIKDFILHIIMLHQQFNSLLHILVKIPQILVTLPHPFSRCSANNRSDNPITALSLDFIFWI